MEKYYLLRKLPWHTMQNISSLQVKSSNIRGLWRKKKIFRRKYSVDMLTDTANVNFGCASFLSQSKKTILLRYSNLLIVFFLMVYNAVLLILVFWTNFLLIWRIFVKFCFSELVSVKWKFAQVCSNCKKTHFNWFF